MLFRKRQCGVAVLAAIFVLLAGTTITAQIVLSEGMDTGWGGGNSISGKVYAPNGARLTRRIQIRIIHELRGQRIGMTDDNGVFIFRGIPTGSFTLIIDKEKEFAPYVTTLDIYQGRGLPGGQNVMSIMLSPRKSSDGPAGIVNADLAGVPKPALEYFGKAQELAGAKDFRGAIEQLELAIKQHPTFMLAYNEMGVQYLRLNDLDKADESLVRALNLKADAFAPMMNRGIVLVMAKKWVEAEAVLLKAVKLKEKSAVTHYFLGQALANQGKWPEAEKELKEAVTLGGPEMKEAHRLLAIIYNVRGDKQKAASQIETYLKLAPMAPDAEQLRRVARQFRGLEAPPATPASNTKPNQ